jgi:putative PIN family toxin of toxin-antitoxin system
MKFVLDTNVLVSATLWTGSAHKTLLLLIGRNDKLYTSKAILQEYARVIRRDFPEIKERLPKLLENIMAFSTITEPQMRLDAVPADPDDNKIIECAVESGAEFILTFDKHLLNLGEYEGIKIFTPEKMRKLLTK